MLGYYLIMVSLIYIIFLFVKILMLEINVPEYFTTISFIMIICEIQLIFIGALGEYIGEIYYKVKKRSHFKVDESNINNAMINSCNDYYEEVVLISKDAN